MQNTPNKIFGIIVFLYLLLGLINLDLIPIPWLDEAACLEPAVMWQRTGHYISKAWPTPGTEDIFLSYPPGILMLHRFTLSVFPPEVFWIRLPFLLLHTASILLLFRTLKNHLQLDWRWATLLVLYFAFDKAVFEISRSVRSEVPEVFLLACWFFVFTLPKSNRLLRLGLLGFISGALLLTHLKEWPVVAVLTLWLLFSEKFNRTTLAYVAGLAILPVGFLVFIDFQIGELYRQLFRHSMEHSAGSNPMVSIWNYFFGRFFPVYKEQPWLPLLHLWVTWLAIKQIKKSFKTALPAALWLFAGLVWLFALGPYYRYFLPMYFVGILIVAQWIQTARPEFPNLKKWYYWPVIAMMLFPFFSRHLLGFIQRPERDPAAAIEFLDKHIPDKGKLLLYGNEIGMYYAAKHSHIDHAHETSPDHFDFDEYNTIYYLTDRDLPGFTRLATYKPQSLKLPAWMYKLGKGGTFAGMHIYKINSDAEWKKVATPFYYWQ